MSYIYVQALIPKAQHRSLTIEALDRDMALQKLLKEIIANYLKERGGENNERST